MGGPCQGQPGERFLTGTVGILLNPAEGINITPVLKNYHGVLLGVNSHQQQVGLLRVLLLFS